MQSGTFQPINQRQERYEMTLEQVCRIAGLQTTEHRSQTKHAHIAELGDVPLELLRRRAAGLVRANVQQPTYAPPPVLCRINPANVGSSTTSRFQ